MAWRPLVFIVLVTAALKSSPLAPFFLSTFWDVLLFTPIAMAVLLLLLARSDRALLRLDKLILALMAGFALWALVTAPFGNAPIRSLAQGLILALVFVFIGLTYWKRWRKAEVIWGDLLLVFCITVAIQATGVVSALVGAEWSIGLSGRLLGIVGNANYVGMLSAAGVVLGLCLASRIQERRTRIVLGLGIWILLVSLLWSGSRGSMFGLAAGLIVMLLIWRAWWFLAGFVVLAASAFALAVALIPDLFDRSGSLDVTSGRGDLWGVMLGHWIESPLLGTGYRSIETLSGTGGYSAHNIFVWVLTELGVVGIVVFIALLVAIGIRGKLNKFIAAAACLLVIELTESTLFGWGGPAAISFWLILLAYPAFAGAEVDDGEIAKAAS